MIFLKIHNVVESRIVKEFPNYQGPVPRLGDYLNYTTQTEGVGTADVVHSCIVKELTWNINHSDIKITVAVIEI